MTLDPTTVVILVTTTTEGTIVAVDVMMNIVVGVTMTATRTMTGVTVIATTTVKGGMMTAADTTEQYLDMVFPVLG